uniref:Cellulose synthase-like protein H1 n=1 Tax=Tanacetum cinerariifolium TaxID=118510 RepID=A0A6L2JA41_TANCI|nr:cellulose synthase-like protein H1 [Tanacetum cinerariifolium]
MPCRPDQTDPDHFGPVLGPAFWTNSVLGPNEYGDLYKKIHLAAQRPFTCVRSSDFGVFCDVNRSGHPAIIKETPSNSRIFQLENLFTSIRVNQSSSEARIPTHYGCDAVSPSMPIRVFSTALL